MIMMCVTTVNYAVIVNGIPTRQFSWTQGIRQGDPIFTNLFLICVEALSAMLAKEESTVNLTRVPTLKRGPRLTHLFFC